MAELSERVRSSLAQQEEFLTRHSAALVSAGVKLGAALARGNKLITLGCPTVAQHLAAEITGRFSAPRRGLPAIWLSENPSSLTAITNDYGREHVYERELSALAQPGDFVLALVAGDDPAACKAVPLAKKLSLEILVLELPGAEEDRKSVV